MNFKDREGLAVGTHEELIGTVAEMPGWLEKEKSFTQKLKVADADGVKGTVNVYIKKEQAEKKALIVMGKAYNFKVEVDEYKNQKYLKCFGNFEATDMPVGQPPAAKPGTAGPDVMSKDEWNDKEYRAAKLKALISAGIQFPEKCDIEKYVYFKNRTYRGVDEIFGKPNPDTTEEQQAELDKQEAVREQQAGDTDNVPF